MDVRSSVSGVFGGKSVQDLDLIGISFGRYGLLEGQYGTIGERHTHCCGCCLKFGVAKLIFGDIFWRSAKCALLADY